MITISKKLINQIVTIMDKNQEVFKESVDNNIHLIKSIDKIRQTQIDILKKLNKLEQK